MKMTDLVNATAQRSAFVAPTLGGAATGTQAGFLRVDAHALVLVPADGIATGRRSWSPPLT